MCRDLFPEEVPHWWDSRKRPLNRRIWGGRLRNEVRLNKHDCEGISNLIPVNS